MQIRIDVRDDLKRVTRSLGDFADRQIPFATATALNAIGKAVSAGERANIKAVFPTATPFTVKSVAQRKARKDRLQTEISVKDIAAAYLEPYLDGGVHKLNSRALLNPKNVNLNQYGNIPKGKLAALRARADVFIGSVETKSGRVDGVWQRLKAKKGKGGPRLKLLIRFGDAIAVKQRLAWGDTAKKIVSATFDREFGRAMAKAIATARLK